MRKDKSEIQTVTRTTGSGGLEIARFRQENGGLDCGEEAGRPRVAQGEFFCFCFGQTSSESESVSVESGIIILQLPGLPGYWTRPSRKFSRAQGDSW